jgi:hypothetical protein
MSTFTPAGSGGLPPSAVTATVTGDTTPLIANVSIPSANTEVSYPLPTSTTRFLLKLRDGTADLKFSYISGNSGTLYFTVPRGNYISVSQIDTSASVTLYFQSPVAGQVAEIMTWSA